MQPLGAGQRELLMENKNLTCLRCNGKMVQGFIPDDIGQIRLVGRWYEGAPKTSFLPAIKTSSTQGIPVAAFRCSSCGLTELFSDNNFEPV
jgi:hypothetical protein